jgi:hypothetical protein
MAHYAILNSDNIVTRVEVVNNEAITDVDGNEQEQLGINLLITLYGDGNYKQTSYNSNFRKNYASVGFAYDVTRDAFIEHTSPYPSWVFNEETCLYESPTPMPINDKGYVWNEETISWQDVPEPTV